MPYYEYEYIVKNLIELLKEKQEAEEKQNEGMDKPNMSGAMREAGKHMPPGMANMASKASSGNWGSGGGFNMPSMPSMPSVANFPGVPSSMKI